MRPLLATKLAASSRACTTILSSPEELSDEADEPAEEAPADEPAKLPASTGTENASSTPARINRDMEISTRGNAVTGAERKDYPQMPGEHLNPVARKSIARIVPPTGLRVPNAGQVSNSLPGFIRPLGSSTRLMPRITAISSALRVLSR